MGEVALGWAINKLDLLLTGEVKLLSDVHKELRDIKDELETIKSFLRDADARLYHKTEDTRINTWLKQVREVAFHIEDVIDAYMLHIAGRQDRHGCLQKIPRFLKKLKARH